MVSFGDEFICPDRYMNIVICTKKRWRHIKEEHPNITPRKQLVINSIKNPDIICKDRYKRHWFVFYKECILSSFEEYEKYLRIVLKYTGNLLDGLQEGRVWTAHPTVNRRIDEEVIWTKIPL